MKPYQITYTLHIFLPAKFEVLLHYLMNLRFLSSPSACRTSGAFFKTEASVASKVGIGIASRKASAVKKRGDRGLNRKFIVDVVLLKYECKI